ncbi:RagB/SusD family nutrient uptake outer membrane protein [Neolewinella sp.]|uniref:RagB/SusD family nutrient uptake outer membrane protein n=1 Tax=Neolewinella sp. TaxID=2993543 RepID=UPI003B5266DD
MKYKFRCAGLLIASLLMVPFQSCTDLEPEVFSDLTPSNFPSSQADIIASYLSAYTNLYPMQNHGSYMSIQEVSSDEALIPQRGSDWFDGGIWLRTHQHQFSPDDSQYNNAWTFLYQGAIQCNSVISLLQGTSILPEDQSAQLIGELRTLRAYWYWLLLDSFGDVPLVTETSDPADTEPTATSREDIYNYVIQEMEQSAENLSRANDGSTYGKINYWANRALLSRIYLNSEVITGTPRYQEAMAVADEVINSNQYSLTENYFTNFDPGNEGSSENIFVIPYADPAQAGGFNIAQMTLHYASQATFNLQDQPWNGYCSLQEFYNSYDDEDVRKGEYGNQQTRGNFLAGPQYAADGETPILDGTADDPGGPELVFTPEINGLNAFRQAGVRIFKYGYGDGAPSTLPNDFPIIRYAEVLMNKAEAMMRTGQSGASMLVNMIRSRAELDDMDDNMSMDDLLAERGREFFYEGTRRQDLIRFGAFDDAWEFKDASTDKYNLFPIPQPQRNANRNLEQNPGY